MSLRVGIPSIGMRAAGTVYEQFEAAAKEAARRNGAALWYVGSDPDGWVYEDSTGTTPATGTDPVGLLLDRSYGASNSTTVFTNDFSVPAEWSAGANWAVSGGVASKTAAGIGQINSVATPLITGKTYKITATYTSVSGTSFNVLVGGGSYNNLTITAGTTTRSIISVCSGTGFVGFQSGDNYSVDNVVAQEVLGYSALQATAANKPTLELQANGYYGMRFDGVNDFLGFDGTRIVNSEYTVITAGAYQDSAATTKSILGGSNNIANTNLLFGTNASRPAFSQWGNDLFGPATYVDNTPAVFSGVLSATGKTIFSGGVSIATDAVATKLSSYPNASIGQGAQTVALPMNGCVWLVAVAPVAMLSADRIAIERFAALLSGATYS